MKTSIFAVFLLTLAAFSGPAIGLAVHNQTLAADKEIIVESAGILPTNPFYFVKKFGWNLRRFFTLNPVKRLDLELEIAAQNVAEIKKLEDIKLDSNKSLGKAAGAFDENLQQLQISLDAVRGKEENSELEQNISNFVEQSLKHQELFDRLKNKHESIRDKIEDVQSRLEEVVSAVPRAVNSENNLTN